MIWRDDDDDVQGETVGRVLSGRLGPIISAPAAEIPWSRATAAERRATRRQLPTPITKRTPLGVFSWPAGWIFISDQRGSAGRSHYPAN